MKKKTKVCHQVFQRITVKRDVNSYYLKKQTKIKVHVQEKLQKCWVRQNKI